MDKPYFTKEETTVTRYEGKRVRALTREEKRRRQRAAAWVKGLAVIALLLCIGYAAGGLGS